MQGIPALQALAVGMAMMVVMDREAQMALLIL
jgi:hypothetical protein